MVYFLRKGTTNKQTTEAVFSLMGIEGQLPRGLSEADILLPRKLVSEK